jgi:hypothetical protein
MDDRDAVGIIDNTNIQRLTGRGRSDEHRDGGVIGLEASPVVSSAWTMSSSETPCLRALASMSTQSGYASDYGSSTTVDAAR